MRNIIVALLFFSNFIFAQIGGQDSYQILKTSFSAREAVINQPIALYDNDINSGILNPAMLNNAMSNSLSLNFVDYFSDINFVSAAYSYNLKKSSVLALNFKAINYGKFVKTNFMANELGQFSANEQLVTLAYGRSLSEKFTVGVNLKFITSVFESYSSSALASDFSLAYVNKNKDLVFSILSRNYGRQLTTFASSKESLPHQIDLGLTKKLAHLPFIFSFGYNHIEQWNLRYYNESELALERSKLDKFGSNLFSHFVFGGELTIAKTVQLRAGYNAQRRHELKESTYLGSVGFSWGIGVDFKSFKIDYGRSTYHLHGSPNYFSLLLDISKFHSKK